MSLGTRSANSGTPQVGTVARFVGAAALRRCGFSHHRPAADRGLGLQTASSKHGVEMLAWV